MEMLRAPGLWFCQEFLQIVKPDCPESGLPMDPREENHAVPGTDNLVYFLIGGDLKIIHVRDPQSLQKSLPQV
jgi:hypothetical protein